MSTSAFAQRNLFRMNTSVIPQNNPFRIRTSEKKVAGIRNNVHNEFHDDEQRIHSATLVLP